MQNAIKENDIALMREAIADGADVNRKDRDGYPYLIRALLESYYDIGYYDIAKLLIESGVDVNLRGKNDMTAICRAVSSGNVEMVRMLIEYGADVNVAEPPVMITPPPLDFPLGLPGGLQVEEALYGRRAYEHSLDAHRSRRFRRKIGQVPEY